MTLTISNNEKKKRFQLYVFLCALYQIFMVESLWALLCSSSTYLMKKLNQLRLPSFRLSHLSIYGTLVFRIVSSLTWGHFIPSISLLNRIVERHLNISIVTKFMPPAAEEFWSASILRIVYESTVND